MNFWETTLASIIAGLATALVTAGFSALAAHLGSKYSENGPIDSGSSAQYDHSILISGPVKGNVDATISDNRSYTNITESHNYNVANSDNTSNDTGDWLAYTLAGIIGIAIASVLFVVASRYLMLIGSILVGFAFGWSLILSLREFRLDKRPTFSGWAAIARALSLAIGFILIWGQIRSATFESTNISEIRHQLTSMQTPDGFISKFTDQLELFSDKYGTDGLLFVLGLILAVSISVVSVLFVVLDCINHSNYLRERAGLKSNEKRAQIYGERSTVGNVVFTICIVGVNLVGFYVAGHDVLNYLAELSSVSQ